MFKKIFVAIAVAVCLATSVEALAQTGHSAGKYASVNGLKMYYEIRGAGRLTHSVRRIVLSQPSLSRN